MRLRLTLFLIVVVALLAAVLPVAADDLSVELVSMTTPAQPGAEFQVTIKTAPGATCTLYSIIPDTGSRSRYPERRTLEADSEGFATWVWDLHRFTREGDGYLEITVESQGKVITQKFTYNVVKQES